MALVFYPIFFNHFPGIILFLSCELQGRQPGCRVLPWETLMGKEKIWIAAGADSRHGNVFLLDSCFQENNAVGFPEIQLILSIVFFVKKTIPVFFIKSILKLKDHIFAYFIAVLADGRADGGKKFCRIGAEFLVHFLYGYFSDFAHGSAPAGMGQANGMMNRVYEIQGHTVCIVGGQHHTRDVW